LGPGEELFQEFRAHASARPDAAAVLAPERTPLTWGDLWRQMEYVAGSAGRCAPITAVILPDGPELLTALLGAMLAGAAAPLDPRLTEAELRRQLASLQPDCALLGPEQGGEVEALLESLGVRVWRACWDETRPAGAFDLHEVPRAGPPRPSRGLPPDTRLLLHTSGATGQPKVAPLSGANLRAGLANQRRCLALTPADRFLCLAPLFHLHGFGSALAQLAAGGSVVCPPGFDPRAFPEWLRQFRPTWYTGGPALHRAVASLAAGAGLPRESLRLVRSSSAPLESSLHAALERILGVPVLDSYGLTETGTVALSPLPPLARKPGSAGVSAGPEISILGEDRRVLPAGAEGEIAVRGPNVIAGYLDDAAANRESFREGWLLTGDLGRLDEEGYLFVTGRRKDVINRGGAKVMPAEIEAALLAHPDVAEAAAFGAPHPTLGEEPEAAVVPRAGAQVTESELRARVAQHLAAFKVPRRIHFTAAIPRTATGKPRRLDLARSFEPADRQPAARRLSPEESRIAAIWSRVLGCPEIAPHDDFFALGGDSLSAAVVLAETQAEFGITWPLFAFFEQPTVERLARLVAGGAAPSGRRAAVHVAGQGPRVPLFCIPALSDDPYYLRHLAARMDRRRPFFVLFTPLEPGGVEEIARAALADIRAARPQGPYVLAGHCFGGVVAFEAARQMRAAGEEVKLLLLLDTPAPGYPKALLRWKRYAPAAWALWRGAGTRALAREAAAHLRVLLGRRPPPAQPGPDGSAAIGVSLRAYAPGPLDVPIVQVLASGPAASTRVLEDARLGWRDFARAGFTAVHAPGDHSSFLLPPQVEETVRGLQPILNSTAL
jgi:acyl-CoA synthetase (AMP-forming)/AMP-acid ligase II/thioesterase domain-containing protein/acyl carrier protein